jgi:hypothetical protein
MSFCRHSVIRMYLVSSSVFVAAGSGFASSTSSRQESEAVDERERNACRQVLFS